jgi:nitroreductase
MPAPLDLFLKRRSPYSFSAQPVSEDVLDTLFEAARWAPSYGNRQPCRFVVARAPDVLERLRGTLTRGNQYARAAPVLVALAADPADAQIREGREYYLLDCGLALENLLLQATTLGLHAHPMGGFDEAGVRSVLAMPEQVRVVALIAIGYPGNPADLDDSTRERDQRERTRKPLDQVRAFDRWEPES